MAGERLVYSRYMASTWLVHGWYMAGIWLVHGWYMAGIWLRCNANQCNTCPAMRRLRLFEDDGEPEGGPLPGRRRDPKRPGHEIHELLADGQPEPRPAEIARRAAVHLTEGLLTTRMSGNHLEWKCSYIHEDEEEEEEVDEVEEEENDM